MRIEIALVASGTATVREWQKEPTTVPIRDSRAYDRFADELGRALGSRVDVVEEPGEDADVLLVPVLQAEELPDELLARTLLLDASPSDEVLVVRKRLLGAVNEAALNAWRRGEPVDKRLLIARVDVAGRMTARVSLMGERFGYTVVDDAGAQGLPAVTAAYLRAWEETTRPS